MTRIASRPHAVPSDAQRAAIHGAVLEWYRHQRRDLPWRRTRDPYAILVAEIMLQQTQVDRVLPKYRSFLELFPTVEALAAAPTGEVIRAWSGLGYNVRAVRLQQAAQRIAGAYAGVFPRDLDALLALPGLGPYTARAVACFAFEEHMPVVDTNVRRVLGRLYRDTLSPEVNERALLPFAGAALPNARAYAWNQALMDLGATVCTSRKPLCLLCPARAHCDALRAGLPLDQTAGADRQSGREAPFIGSTRYYRGRIMAALRVAGPDEAIDLPALGLTLKPDFAADDLAWLEGLLAGLERDGLVERTARAMEAGIRLPQ